MAKSLFKAVMLVAIFSIITRVLGFIFRIYLSRELGAEMLGVYHIASSIFIVLVLLVSSGIPLSVSKHTARNLVQNNKKSINGFVSSALIFGAILSVIICVFIFVFKDYVSKIFTDKRCLDVLLILLPAVLFSAIYSSLRGYLWGRQDYFSMGLSELIEQVIRILVFILFAEVFVVTLSGAIIAAISLVVACFFSMLYIVILYFKKGGKLKSSKGHFKNLIKSSVPITGVRTASSLIQPLIAVLFPAMLVVGGTTNEVAVSIYGVVMGMTFPLLFLPSTLIGSLSFTLIPELSKAQEENQNKLVEERIKSGIVFAILTSSIIIPIYVGLGVPICEFLFDNTLSGEFLKYAAIIMLPMGLSNITSSILNSFNLEVKSFINNILGGFFLVLNVVCLSPFLGAYALILGFLICMLTTTILNIIMIKKHKKISLKITKPIILSLLFCVPSSLFAVYSFNVFCFIFPTFVCLGLSSFVSILCFVLLLHIFKVCNISFVFLRFKKMLKISKKKA